VAGLAAYNFLAKDQDCYSEAFKALNKNIPLVLPFFSGSIVSVVFHHTLIFLKFQPDCVNDGNERSQRQPQYPSEIPHILKVP
jgi:hypothetical protein